MRVIQYSGQLHQTLRVSSLLLASGQFVQVEELFTTHDVQDEDLFFRDAVEEAQRGDHELPVGGAFEFLGLGG